MSRQLFINNNDVVPAPAAGVTNPNAVANERFAIFNADDYSAGTLDADSATSAESVVFVQGGDDNEAIISSIIHVDDVVDVVEKDYVAPTAQATTVTPATGTGTATVRVVQTNTGFKPHERQTVSIQLDNKTAAQIVDDFVEQFNKQFPDFVTASNVANELVLTGNIGVSFETSLDDEAVDWTTSVVAPNFGTGTAEHVANLEEIAYGGDYTNRIYLPIKPPSYVDMNSTYKLITVRVKTNTTPNISSSNKYQELTIALHSGTALDNIDLGTFFGV